MSGLVPARRRSLAEMTQQKLDLIVALGLTSTQAHVLGAIVDHANAADGWAWPGLPRLEAVTRRSRTTIKDAIGDLIRFGVLEHRRAAPGRCAAYRLSDPERAADDLGRRGRSTGHEGSDVADPPATSDEADPPAMTADVADPPATSASTWPERGRDMAGPPAPEQGTGKNDLPPSPPDGGKPVSPVVLDLDGRLLDALDPTGPTSGRVRDRDRARAEVVAQIRAWAEAHLGQAVIDRHGGQRIVDVAVRACCAHRSTQRLRPDLRHPPVTAQVLLEPRWLDDPGDGGQVVPIDAARQRRGAA